MEDVIGAAFAAVLAFVSGLAHHASFRDSASNSITRRVDAWWARWYEGTEARHGMLGFMAAGCFFMTLLFLGALAYEIVTVH